MYGRYVEPLKTRHREEYVGGVPQLRIPMRRQWFVLAFLPFWLGGWTIGGIAAMHQLSERFDAFIAFWLCGWFVGWVFAASVLVSQLGASEVVRVVGGDLEVSAGVGRLRRTWRYRGGAIENLSSNDPASTDLWGRQQMGRPFFLAPKSGAVKFDYGAQYVFLATGVEEPEGRVIADWLARRLPRRATAS